MVREPAEQGQAAAALATLTRDRMHAAKVAAADADRAKARREAAEKARTTH